MNASNQTIQVISIIESGDYTHLNMDPWHRLYSIKLGTILVALGITTAVYCTVCLLCKCYRFWINCNLGPGSMVRSLSRRPIRDTRSNRTEIMEEIKIPKTLRKT